MPLPPIPWRAPVIPGDLKDRLIGRDAWAQWFLAVQRAIDSAPLTVGTPTALTAQGAALPATTVVVAPSAGLYRVSFYARLTRAAGVSSSLQTFVTWTDGGVSRTKQGAAVTSNLVAGFDTQIVLVQADQGTPIQIGTLYSSSGSPTMQYALTAQVEAIA
jgi:hypothetical protein